MELLYEGPHDDACAVGVKTCDSRGTEWSCCMKDPMTTPVLLE